MRRGFTLIELLVVIGIMGLMVTVGIVGLQSGKSRMQLAGATRDVLALMRQARAIALITQKPSLVTYSNETVDEEPCARVVVSSEKLFDDVADEKREVRTLSGELVGGEENVEKTGGGGGSGKVEKLGSGEEEKSDGGGESLNDIFSAPISLDVTKGLKLKVEKGEDAYLPASSDGKVYKSAISVFSTTEYVESKYAVKKAAAEKVESQGGGGQGKGDSSAGGAADDTMTEPVKIVWQTNGRTEPHKVWIYPDGSAPDRGLTIEVDKFGDCKVSQWKEDER